MSARTSRELSAPSAALASRSADDSRSVRRNRKKVRRGWTATPYLFLLPYLVLFVGFVLIPAIYGFYISLHDWDYLLPHKPWVGFRNYTDLFKSNLRDGAAFWQSMRATGLFVVFSVPFLVACPLGIALMLNRAKLAASVQEGDSMVMASQMTEAG